MQIHAERNTIIKRWRLHGQLLRFHAQGDHQTVPLIFFVYIFSFYLLPIICIYISLQDKQYV